MPANLPLQPTQGSSALPHSVVTASTASTASVRRRACPGRLSSRLVLRPLPPPMLARTRLLLVAFGLLATGCDSNAQSGTALSVETTQTVYAPGDIITLAVTNHGADPVYITNEGCSGADRQFLPAFRFERRGAGGWEPFSPGYGCYAVYVPPTELAPGESHTTRFPVGVNPNLLVPAGTYRLIVPVTDETQQTLLPLSVRTTNAFEVTG